MQETFGNPAARAQEQAQWITSPEFNAGLQNLSPAEAQAKVQEAVSGLAMLDPTQDPTQNMRRADAALYVAKSDGRDRLVWAED